MTIVQLLSPAVDLSPLYDTDMPLECLDWDRGGLLSRSKQFWEDIFPAQSHIIIDPGAVSVYYKLGNEDDILSLPGANPAQALFIYSAFILALEWDPRTLFVPAHYQWQDLESMGTLLRHLFSDDLAGSGFIQLAHTGVSARESLFIPGTTLYKQPHFELINKGKSVSYYEWKDKQEKNPEFQAYSFLPMYVFNVLDFQENIPRWKQDYQDLFYLLIDAFRDEIATHSLLTEVILKLQEWNLCDINRLVDDVMILPISGQYQSFHDLPTFAKLLESDEQGNYSRGPVDLQECHHCLVINQSDRPVTVSGQSNRMILISEDASRFCTL